MKNFNILTASFSALAIALVVASCATKTDERTKLNNGNVVTVKVATVEEKEIEGTLRTSGLLFTDNEARMAFKIGGLIDKINVREGDNVKKGQLLAVLKGSEIDAQYEQAILAKEKAQRDYERAAKLFKDEVATKEQLENAKTALDVATKTVEMVAFNRQYAEIRAKSDGFVLRKLANEGEIVGVGTPVLVVSEKSPSSGWMLRAGLSDKDWVEVAPGQKATVQLDAYPGRIFQGEVIRKSQAADQGTGSFQVEIGIAFADETPAVGMFGKAEIKKSGKEKYPVIPYQAMIEAYGNTAYVMVPTSATTVAKLPVTIHSFNKEDVFIKSGLSAGDKIVITNAPFLNDNSVVNILN